MIAPGVEWAVKWVCTGGGSHASKVLLDAFLRPPDPELLAALCAGHGDERGRILYEQSRVSHTVPGHLRGLARRGGIERQWRAGDVIPQGADPSESTWRLPPCPKCRRPVPDISGPRMRKLMGDLYAAGESRQDVSDRSSMLWRDA